MTTANNEEMLDWKRLWQLVSGINYETPEDTVQAELLNVAKELESGLLQFKDMSASTIDIEKLLEQKKQEKLLMFTQRLQELLNLESKQCWEILCYYLQYEYRGSASLLTVLLSTETNMSKLLDNIWGYYTLQRMIILKIVKNLFIYFKVPSHPYHHEYEKVVEHISIGKLQKSYLKQLEYLINEKPPSKLASREFFNYNEKLIKWSERNAREINEVLHILLLIGEQLPFTLEQIKTIFECFKQHAFGRQQQYFVSNNSVHQELIQRITYSELILFLKCVDFDDVENCRELAGELIDALADDIERMYQRPENGPMLLAWMLLNFRFKNAAENLESSRKFRLFGKRAIDLNCFEYLRNMLTNEMLKNDSLVSQIARRTVHNLLNHMCDLFDNDGTCANYPSIYELLAELLSWPTLAKQFCSSETGTRSLYNTLLEVFPYNLIHMSMLATALIKGGMGAYVKSQMDELPIFTDTYEHYGSVLRAVSVDDYVLTKNINPFPHIDYTIYEGTTAVVMSRAEGYCVHFRKSINYFNVLHHEMNCLLSNTGQNRNDFVRGDLITRVNEGLKYLCAELQRTKSISAVSAEMVHPTEMCIDLLNKYKYLQNPPVVLLASCLNVCTALLRLVDQEIYLRVINLDILPVITNTTLNDFKKYSIGVHFDSKLVGSYLVQIEKKTECYDFFLAYLNFLRTYTKLQRNNYFEVEIPGLIFLLLEIFPNLHTWHFQIPIQRNKIYAEIMGLICDILDSVGVINKTDNNYVNKQLLRNICIYSLLNLENGLVLLRFVALGNAYLQYVMEMESNWMVQQSSDMVLLVRLAMRILMQLLRLKSTVFNDGNELSPLEALIYTQPKQRDTLRIISVVTSYMSNIFDRWLPILSCRLLRRIALQFNMSLLACLDMEPDQIRLIFLQKLPDDLESDSLKVAVIEMVEACVEKQPGVTEAFFKVNYAMEKRLFEKETDKQIADSILTFIEVYLNSVEKDPQIVAQILPSKIMNLFHTLWKQNMQILVESLIEKSNFWEQLCSPLFSDFKHNVRAYGQLFNILAIEVYRTTSKEKTAVKNLLLKLFEGENFKKLLDFVFDLPRIPSVIPTENDLISEDVPDWLARLQAFKGLLLVILKKQPQLVELPKKQYKLLAEMCLRVLVDRSSYIDDLRPFIILSELYLFILLNSKHSYTETPEEDAVMLKEMNKMLIRVACCYEGLHVRAREACLAITVRSANLLTQELIADSSIALNFLHSVVSIICTELQSLENCVRVEVQTKNSTSNCQNSSTTSVILSLNLLKTVAIIFHNNGPRNWDMPFISGKVFQRLLSCTSYILQMHSKQQLSVELLDVLLVFAKGNCSGEFLHCDVGDYLWLKLLPPKELLTSDFTNATNSTDKWTAQKWWPIYARGIELVTILFKNHNLHFLKDILQFVGIHEEYLVDSLILGKQSLEPLAVNLIKSAVTLIVELVPFEKQWRLEHAKSLFNLMRSLQVLMGHCISMFHQPKNLKCLLTGDQYNLGILRENENPELADDITATLNDLTEIIILCVKCLKHFSPTMIDLICEPEFVLSKWEPIFEINFGAPKLNENDVSLSFGTALSIVGVYIKALNLQNYAFHEVPLNAIPNHADTTNVAETQTVSRQNNTRRLISKSLSTTSVSSSNCPSNEMLSNLDGELCLMALEHILTLAASQCMLTLKNLHMPPREKQLVRRETNTEIFAFYEFVRRKVMIDQREHKSIWYRRKHGQVLMQTVDEEKEKSNMDIDAAAKPALSSTRISTDANKRHSSDLRVNVVRRLHLQQQLQRTPALGGNLNISHSISPISAGNSEANLPESSTPCGSRSSLRRQGEPITYEDNVKRFSVTHDINDQEHEEDDIVYFSPEEPKNSPLSYVQLVEEDYLHFLSNIFTVICQVD